MNCQKETLKTKLEIISFPPIELACVIIFVSISPYLKKNVKPLMIKWLFVVMLHDFSCNSPEIICNTFDKGHIDFYIENL